MIVHFNSLSAEAIEGGEDGPLALIRSLLSSKRKGPGEEGAPRNHPEVSSQKVADFKCRLPYDSYVNNRAPFWPFLGEGFWGNIRRPILLPAPCFTVNLPSLIESFSTLGH